MAEIIGAISLIGSKIVGLTTAATQAMGGLTGVGSALTAGATIYSGMQAQKSAEAEAASMKQKGDAEFAAGQRDAMRRRKEKDLVMSRQRAVAAASGGSATDPSITATMARTEAEGEYNAMLDMYNGAINRSDLYASGRNRQKEGKGAMFSSLVDAGTTIYGDMKRRRRLTAEYSI